VIVKARDFDEMWFRIYAQEMGEEFRLHRKLWEFCVIAREYNCSPGYALGFGVGKEPLGTWIAAQGGAVTVTDRPDVTPEWTDTGQHSLDLRASYQEIPGLSYEDYSRAAIFRPVDMNVIPEDLLQGHFDFTWSCGSFEHLGGIDQGIEFFCTQMRALRPGGLAAHTTEFNLGEHALNTPTLCLFQPEDLKRLEARLAAQGDALYYDLTMGDEPEDLHVDKDPYGLPHLKLEIGGRWQTTSILLVGRKG
jgi:hypothetical protein